MAQKLGPGKCNECEPLILRICYQTWDPIVVDGGQFIGLASKSPDEGYREFPASHLATRPL